MESILSGLYYPFSRTIDLASLKQMLLVFEKVCFLDPVDDETWRAGLYRNLENREDERFYAYREVHDNLGILFQEGVVQVVDPAAIQIGSPVVTAAALSDLLDRDWCEVAANPARYGMPHRCLAADGGATWQIFEQKLPVEFISALDSQEALNRHLVSPGSPRYSWTLTYEAGSAITLGVHLAAAEQLRLAPVTDSRMHHELLMRKIIRQKTYTDQRSRPIDKSLALQLAQSTASALIEDLLPRDQLRLLNMDTLLLFREQTRHLRSQMITDLSSRLEVMNRVPGMDDLLAAGKEIQLAIRSEIRTYRAELNSVRNKIWPSLLGSVNSTLAPGGVAAVAMNFIGGPGYALATSIVAASLALLKTSLDLRVENRRLEESRSPAISYITQVARDLARK